MAGLFVIPLVVAADERPWTEQYPVEVAGLNQSCAAKQFAECRAHLLRLKDLLDGRGDIIYRLAKVEASLGDRGPALEWLTLYSKMGLRLADPAAEPAFASLKDEPDFKAAMARLQASAEAVTASRTFATLKEKDLIAEDIAYDEVKSRFYISSVRHKKILSMNMDGSTADFVPEGDWPILAVAADSRRRVLWATAAAMPEGLGYKAADEGKSAVLKFNLDSGKLLKRYDLPAGEKHSLGDMTLSAAGDAYISDGIGGTLYVVDHERDQLEVLIGPGTFNSPQTPALSPDGRRLFVPDYSRGISVVNLATKECKLLAHPADLSLAGLDGLYLANGVMIAMQNGTTPERLIRMHLDSELTKITSWETIEANWKGLGDPTHGVRVKDRFYFIVNSGWDVKLPGGTFEEAPAIRVMSWK